MLDSEKSLYVKGKHNQWQDRLVYLLIGLAVSFTVGILVYIIGYIFVTGVPHINGHFLTGDYDDVTKYVRMTVSQEDKANQLGIGLEKKMVRHQPFYVVETIDKQSPFYRATEKIVAEEADGSKKISNQPFVFKKGYIIKKIGGKELKGMDEVDLPELINQLTIGQVIVKVTIPGGGIKPMLVTTLMIIGLSILISGFIGIFAAIYLVEYAKPGRMVRLIRFGTESLAGIPSIIYGLFGLLFFGRVLGFNYSILSGSLTLSIILLPVIIRQTEESLKAVPNSYREGSLGLGATKIQTIVKIILPSAIPGIIVAVILSIGRIVGESAALLLTAGTAARIPNSIFESGATLTIKAYQVAQEEGNYEVACAIGTIIIVIILVINFSSKYFSKHFALTEH